MSDKKYTINDLIKVMADLRNPDGGCPWDLEQDFASIAPYTIEEAYEVADAIDRGDMKNLREELGDLLLQPIYHAQMATEQAIFDIHDVINDITAKMISRHPHVFGERDAQSASDVNKIWDEQKSKEQGQNADILGGVPASFPALLRAQKLQKKAGKVGFQWTKPEQIFDKLEEELAELREACATGTLAQKQDELGDVLFVLANLGRILDINAEEALRQTNAKFIRRFNGLCDDLKKQGVEIADASLEQMQEAWNAQKKKEKSAS